MYKILILLIIFLAKASNATDITCPSVEKIEGEIESISKIVDSDENKIHFFIAIPNKVKRFPLSGIFVTTDINSYSKSISLPIKWDVYKEEAVFKIISGKEIKEFQINVEYGLCGPSYEFRVKV